MSISLTIRPLSDMKFEPLGYRLDGKTWAVVELAAHVDIVAHNDETLAGLVRLRDAIDVALTQARQAEQDEALADLAEVQS